MNIIIFSIYCKNNKLNKSVFTNLLEIKKIYYRK